MYSIVLGQPCEFAIHSSGADGAFLDLFYDKSQMLVIQFNDITMDEADSFREADIYCTLLTKDNAIRLVWIFKQGDETAFELDTEFDARLIPTEELTLTELSTEETRITLTIVLVDTKDTVVKGLRYLTIPPELSRALIDATEKQLMTKDSDQPVQHIWAQYSVSELASMDKAWRLGL